METMRVVLATALAISALSTLILVGLALATRCTNVQAFIWPGEVRCQGDANVTVLVAVDDVISRDGLADKLSLEHAQILEDIARETSAEAVTCALSQLIDSYSNPVGMPPPPVYLARAGRAQSFLDDHKIVVTREAL